MAKSVDNFSDLQELGIDCGDDEDELTATFLKAADHLKTLLPSVDNAVLLLLYAYYKQAIEGRCNISKPSWYDLKAKQKWEAWNNLGDMDKNRAKLLYITTIQKLNPNFQIAAAAPNESWITVSTLQGADEILNENEKSLADYVKENNCSQVAKILKTCGKEILAELDSEGLALIHWAADHGFVEMIQLLLSFGTNVNLQDAEKQTPLHFAVSCGHESCVRLLLEHGADVNAEDVYGQSSLTVSSDDTIRNLLIDSS